jgi:hypothetical protein
VGPALRKLILIVGLLAGTALSTFAGDHPGRWNIYSESGKYQGFARDSRIYNESGEWWGTIRDNTIFNSYGDYWGHVLDNNHIIDSSGNYRGRLIQ